MRLQVLHFCWNATGTLIVFGEPKKPQIFDPNPFGWQQPEWGPQRPPPSQPSLQPQSLSQQGAQVLVGASTSQHLVQ
jgi:hypothetical protein